jgi:hypothetical protein
MEIREVTEVATHGGGTAEKNKILDMVYTYMFDNNNILL